MDITNKIVNILREIYDPEIPINIYDLGLVKRINVINDSKKIEIDMIFTTGNQCTLLDLITVQVKYKIKREFPDYDVIVNVDRFGRWSYAMMTYEGRALLEEIYGREVVEKLINNRIEDLVSNNLRIKNENKIDPKEYMRRILEDRYKIFKEWLERNKIEASSI